MSWSPWTYKAVNQGGWAVVNMLSGMRVNVDTDSYEQILNMCNQIDTRSTNAKFATDRIPALTAAAAQ